MVLPIELGCPIGETLFSKSDFLCCAALRDTIQIPSVEVSSPDDY